MLSVLVFARVFVFDLLCVRFVCVVRGFVCLSINGSLLCALLSVRFDAC